MKIIISGGGTGGHIYPAIAIADELKKRDNKIEILFIGAKDRMEMQRVPKAGYKIKGLWISGIQRKRSLKNLVVPIKLISSLIKAGRIIMSFKPDVVIGVGGYASGPTLRMAALYGKPTLIQEQNSYAGITNRLLAKHVDKICVAYNGMDKYFPADKLVLTGNPIRSDLQYVKEKEQESTVFFDRGHNQKTVLMIGGSLGAKSLNEAALSAYELLKDRPDILFIWQTGVGYYDAYKTSAIAALPNVRIMAFIDRMDLAYALADVIIARAGALTISELGLVGKPAILVPSPHVAEDHQTKNAQALVDLQAAILIPDRDAKDKLFEQAIKLLDDETMLNSLEQNVKNTARPNATRFIVDEILELIK